MSKGAMKLACKALRDCHYYMINAGLPNQSLLNEAFTAYMELEAALAKQPAQQELAAVVSGYYGGQCVILPIDPARIFNSNTALYTSPPPCPTCEALARTVMLDQTSHDTQRTWVGLTDEEQTQVAWSCGAMSADWLDFARAIEDKLKEKNT